MFPAESCELLLRPDALEGEAARLVPVDDLLPRLGALRESCFVFEQERRAVEGTDVLGVELQPPPPVRQCLLDFAEACVRLSSGRDQRGVIRRTRDAGLCDRQRLAIVARREVRLSEETVFAHARRIG